ncbi:MAG: lipoyl(octanoyl) transferase LipB [Legionellales bacterium]|nr:lipoyl(octanoyl) transferase LipB [Legionellales bacterium]
MVIITRELNQQPYLTVWENMRQFTADRTPATTDELWFVQHPPVFTQGQGGRPEHVLNPHNIPIVHTDRGGQVTYHGPGQAVVYTLIDLRRRRMTIRQLVSALEQSVIALLAEYQLTAQNRCDAPGVYLNDAKICSLGLRIRHGCAYHGLALNVAMDLSPFSFINPCGHPNLRVTQLTDYYPEITIEQLRAPLQRQLQHHIDQQYPSV